MQLLKDFWNHKSTIWELSKNDFKSRFSGSMFGITWAFVQPIMTILTLWFVFQVGFRATNVQDVPFICWFAAGIIPWFFFSEAWSSGVNVFSDYQFLIKKVKFKVSMLPLIKVCSALFIHVVFVIFLIVLYAIYGFYPSAMWFQLIYYTGCMIMLATALILVTASIAPFWKDIGNIVSILLQFGMWFTPIMWPLSMIPEKYVYLFKINPMYYIVQGYRDTLIEQVGFWHRYNQTIWFWTVTFILFMIGTFLYKKLKPHFSDVL